MMIGSFYTKNKAYTQKIFFGTAVLIVAIIISCKQTPPRTNIRGSWKSIDGKTKLKVTAKEFILDEGEEPIAESYFVKGDTIFTSYEGSQPYTKFEIKEVSGNALTLIYPDSTIVRFAH